MKKAPATDLHAPPVFPNELSRRQFIHAMTAAGIALSTLPTMDARSAPNFAVERATVAPPRPVLSFHLDQPYIDYSGTAIPFHPPRGARGGAPLEQLDEAAFRSLCCFS